MAAGECQHCWHSMNAKGEYKPTCCWCGASIVLSFAPNRPRNTAHGHHVPRQTLTAGQQEALATLESVRGALRSHGLSVAEDEVLAVMDQIAGWCSPDMQV